VRNVSGLGWALHPRGLPFFKFPSCTPLGNGGAPPIAPERAYVPAAFKLDKRIKNRPPRGGVTIFGFFEIGVLTAFPVAHPLLWLWYQFKTR
jgi:hypothetical protein